jgi:hypothetical protein
MIKRRIGSPGRALDEEAISEEPRTMYTIVGGDGQRYGPVSADQLRQWIAQGRANGQTLTYREGGDWKPLSTYPEFADLFSPAAGAAPGATTGPAPGAFPSAMTVSAPEPPPHEPGYVASTQMARSMVQVPGLLVAITGGVGVALYSVNLILRMFGIAMTPPPMGTGPELDWVFDFFAGGAGVALDVVWLGLSVVVLIGGLQMLQLQRYTFCLCAAILALLPCISPCCCIGLPAGIWALIILAKPEVRGAFVSGTL